MAKKISLITILLLLVLLVFSEHISTTSTMRVLRGSMEHGLTITALTTARLTAEALAMNFLSFLQEEVEQIKLANPDVVAAVVVNADGEILAHTDETQVMEQYDAPLVDTLEILWHDDGVRVRAPVQGGSKLEGNLILEVDTTTLARARRGILALAFVKFAGVVIVGISLSLWLGARIARPLKLLASYAKNLPAQDFTTEREPPDRIRALPARHRDEVGLLADSFLVMERRLGENIRNLLETTAAKERIEGELNVAREIQQGLLPSVVPPFPDRSELDLYAVLTPAREVGGDLFDFFFVDDTHLCVAVGDVSNKGVPAALFMAITMTLIRNAARVDSSPAAMMTQINDTLSRDNPRCMFVTLWIGILDVTTGRLRYTNGGHNPPIHCAAGRAPGWVSDVHGPVVGGMDGVPYGESTLRLAPGDGFLLYTDGVTEAMNPAQELLEEERLLTEMASIGKDAVEGAVSRVMELVRAHAAGAPQSDDITVLMLRYNGSDDASGQAPLSSSSSA